MVKAKHIAKALLRAVEEGELAEKDAAAALLDFVEERGIALQLPAIVEALRHEAEHRKAEHALCITLPHKATDALIESIRSHVGADEETPVEVVEDKEMLGGFTARHKGKFYDGSVRGYLEKLRTALYS